jgi:hypothetical protein
MTTPTSPDELRAEIAQTRTDLGETAAALAAKADVPARVKQSAADKGHQVAAKATEIRDQATAKAGEIGGQAAEKAGELSGQAAVKAGEIREQAALKAAELRGKVTDEVSTTKVQLQNGDVAAVARRPVPIAALAGIAAVAVATVLIIRRARR